MEFFFDFSCITPHTRKIKKSTVEFHTSKNILKMIKKKETNHAKFCSIYRIHIYTLWYVDFM
jgi:hypothetical protein